MRKWTCIFILTSASVLAGPIAYEPGVPMGTPPKDITPEISGLAISRVHPDVAWVHNDSGDGPRVYALSLTTGDLLSVAEMPEVSSKDWEDIAIGPGPDERFDYLYIADMGNNSLKKKSFLIHRTPEPIVVARPEFKAAHAIAKDVETFTFEYPNPDEVVFDAEALLVDPETGEITIVTKDDGKNDGTSFIFRSDGSPSSSGTNRLILVGEIPLGKGIRNRANGGDVSADGKWVILRTYLQARLYRREPGQHVADTLLGEFSLIELAIEPQGEAIAFAPSDDSEFPTFYSATELGPKAVNFDQTMRPISKYRPMASK